MGLSPTYVKLVVKFCAVLPRRVTNQIHGHTRVMLKKVPCVPQSIFITMGSSNLNSMFLKPVKELELFNIINSCKSKQSTHVDDLSMYIGGPQWPSG